MFGTKIHKKPQQIDCQSVEACVRVGPPGLEPGTT